MVEEFSPVLIAILPVFFFLLFLFLELVHFHETIDFVWEVIFGIFFEGFFVQNV